MVKVKKPSRKLLSQEEVIDRILSRHMLVLKASYLTHDFIETSLKEFEKSFLDFVMTDQIEGRYSMPIDRISKFMEESFFFFSKTEKLVTGHIIQVTNEVAFREREFLRNLFPDFANWDVDSDSGKFLNGVHIAEWVNTNFVPFKRDVVGLFRIYASGMRTYSDLVNSVVGTSQNSFKDGLVSALRTRLNSLARTFFVKAANDERLSFYRSNPDGFRGVIWVNPLGDSSRDLDGGRTGNYYSIPTLSSDGKSFAWSGTLKGFNSRSTQAPILASTEKYSIQENWFGGQRDEFKSSILGPRKFKLWSAGKLTKTQAFDFSNSHSTIRDL